jgi:hypothetical protein
MEPACLISQRWEMVEEKERVGLLGWEMVEEKERVGARNLPRPLHG